MVGHITNADPNTPDVFSLSQIAGHLISAALAPNSQAVYRRATLKFAKFSLDSLHKSQFFPVSINDLILFASSLFMQTFSPATIQTYVFGVCYVNNLLTGINHAKSFLLQKTLQGIKRQGAPQTPRQPITIDVLHSLLRSISASSDQPYDKLLYQAMFTLAFHCFLRVGEFTVRDQKQHNNILQLGDLTFTTVDVDQVALQLTLRFYKGNTGRTPFHIIVRRYPSSPWCPVSILRNFLAVRGSSPGALFCHPYGRSITRSEFSSNLTRYLTVIGLHGANIKPHSFRIGAATTACANGVSDDNIQRLGRWKSDAYKKYIRMPRLTSQV